MVAAISIREPVNHHSDKMRSYFQYKMLKFSAEPTCLISTCRHGSLAIFMLGIDVEVVDKDEKRAKDIKK